MGYQEVHSYLRTGSPADPEMLARVADLDGALNTRPTGEALVVTRGMGIAHLDVDDLTLLTGAQLLEQAYTSVSLGSLPAVFRNAPAVIHAVVPAGTPAMWMEKFNGFERELMLERGLTLRVDRVVLTDDLQWQLFGRYVRPSSAEARAPYLARGAEVLDGSIEYDLANHPMIGRAWDYRPLPTMPVPA